MNDEALLARISVDSSVMVGKPVIHGTRLTVEYVLNLLAHGSSAADVIEEYPGLTLDDIHACLLFAKKSLETTTFIPAIRSA